MEQYKNPASSFDQAPSTRQVHLSDYLNILWNRKWTIVTFFLIVVCVVAFKTRSTKRVYESVTQVFIQKNASFMKGLADVDMDPSTQTYNTTQNSLLKSRDLASVVIKDLGLRKYIASISSEKPDPVTLMLKKVTKFFKSLVPQASSNLSKSLPSVTGKEVKKDRPKVEDRAVDWYLSKLQVQSLPGSSLVKIGFLCQSPEMSARVANAHARVFIRKNRQDQYLASVQALEWLKTQLRDHKIKVEESARKVNEYKYKMLSQLSMDSKSMLSLPEFAENHIIADLERRLNQFKVQKTVLAAKYGPKYPKTIEIDTNIKQLKQEIIKEMQAMRLAIGTELGQFQVVSDAVKRGQGVPQLNPDSTPTAAVSYDMLKFEAESDRKIYDLLLQQANEISLTGNLAKSNIRIIDEAEISRRPIKPDVLMNFLLSVVLGLGFGVGFAFFFEYMDNSVKTHEDVAKALQMPVLGELPYDKSLKKMNMLALASSQADRGNKKIGYGYGRHDISSSLITGLSLMHSRGPGQVFLVESATAGEGKTTFLVKSAISLATGGLRVLMVDADLQQPSLQDLFKLGDKGDRGLINAVENTLSHDLRQGTLDKSSVADLFFIISLKKDSGQLIIRSDDQAMTVFFENGRLVYLQSKNVPFSSRLGSMLQRGGFVTEDQLKDALERNQRTGQPLGYILINAGYINQDQLQGPLKLQMEEHLQKLFSWKHGSFSFEPGSVETCEDKRIYFQEDYTATINHLGRLAGCRLLEKDIFSYIQSVNVPNLSLLPVGKGNILVGSSVYFTLLLGKYFDLVKQRFDVILVDAPPILETMCSASPLFSIVDGVIFVVKSGHVSVKHIKEAKDQLKKAKANVIGTILNQVKVGKKHNSYYV